MNKAIVTGATGFIGSQLVRILLKNGIDVLALGRKPWSNIDSKRLSENKHLTYMQIDMSDMCMLPEKVNEIKWNVGSDCTFFNFAWGGVNRLSDLNVEAQMSNVIWSANALEAASKLKCERFIHVGTMEEAFTEKYLDLNYKTNTEYNRHVVYSVAKKTSRDLLKLLSYKYGIPLIIATNSHVMGPNDDKDSFLQVTLEKLVKGEDLIFSTGEQIFDVISVTDCANAYKLIAEHGKPGAEYWIGSGEPRRLREYVEIMGHLYKSSKPMQFGMMPYNDISLKLSDFSIENLVADTGFKPANSFEDTVHELYQWLFNNIIID